MNVAVIIPFRDRGLDPLRLANLDYTLRWWLNTFGRMSTVVNPIQVVSDGRGGDEQFCRSHSYNMGAAHTDADVLIFAESDMLIGYGQIHDGIKLAAETPGLVVPFTQYRYLTKGDSAKVLEDGVRPEYCKPEFIMDNGRSVGAINIVSRKTLEAVGQWDEIFEGSWYDDRAMEMAFSIAAGPTRFVNGPAYHLYHLPGWQGSHLTKDDKAATARNRARYDLYTAAGTPERIRELTAGGE